jgi:hypothetical protein
MRGACWRARLSGLLRLPIYVGSREVLFAGVAELVDARDLGSRDESRGGSNPSARTIAKTPGNSHQAAFAPP